MKLLEPGSHIYLDQSKLIVASYFTSKLQEPGFHSSLCWYTRISFFQYRWCFNHHTCFSFSFVVLLFLCCPCLHGVKGQNNHFSMEMSHNVRLAPKAHTWIRENHFLIASFCSVMLIEQETGHLLLPYHSEVQSHHKLSFIPRMIIDFMKLTHVKFIHVVTACQELSTLSFNFVDHVTFNDWVHLKYHTMLSSTWSMHTWGYHSPS